MHWKFPNHCKNSGETRALHAPFTRALPSNTTLHSGNVHRYLQDSGMGYGFTNIDELSHSANMVWFFFFFPFLSDEIKVVFFFFWVGWVFGDCFPMKSHKPVTGKYWLWIYCRCAHFAFSSALSSSVGARMPQARFFFSFSYFCYLWRFHINWVLNVKNSCFKVVTQVPGVFPLIYTPKAN